MPSSNPTPKTSFVELGTTGLKRYGYERTFIHEEFLPALQGQRAIDVYSEMRWNEPIIGAFFFAIEMLIRNVEWQIRPGDSEEAADFVEECRQDLDMTWQDFITEVLSMLQYGWAWHEIVYKPRTGERKNKMRTTSRFDDGKIGWYGFPIRSQDSLNGWEYYKGTDQISGMRQLAPPDYRENVIPWEKSLHFRTSSQKNNPEGKSILRNAYRPWFFKKRMEEIEGIGVERDLAGLPVAYCDPEILTSTKPDDLAMRQALLKLVQNIRRDKQEGILFPLAYDDKGNELFKLELLSTGGQRQIPTNEVITRYDQRIAMTVLADFILLGTQNVGSWALSADKSNLFGMAINTWLSSIAEVFNKYAIPRLLKINKMLGDDEPPTLEHGEVQPPNLQEFGEFIAKLSGSGMPLFPDEDLEAHIRQIAHLPEKSEEAKQLQEEAGLMQLDMQQQQAEVQRAGAEQAKAGAGEKKVKTELEPKRFQAEREDADHSKKLAERQQSHAEKTTEAQQKLAEKQTEAERKKKQPTKK